MTNFFRDNDAYKSLEQQVVPQIFADNTLAEQVRVWVAGCATGEEAYSVAILLHEHAARLADPPKIQIFATDIDADALATARDCRYNEIIAADLSPERLRRFFVKEGQNYIVKKELRDSILFAPHNLLRDPPFSRIDLISCRNLLIYFNRNAQDVLLGVLHFVLRHGGFLFLGGSESAEGRGFPFRSLGQEKPDLPGIAERGATPADAAYRRVENTTSRAAGRAQAPRSFAWQPASYTRRGIRAAERARQRRGRYSSLELTCLPLFAAPGRRAVV